MKLSAGQRSICERVVNVFETGSTKGNYSAISIYPDGPNGIRQITYGRSQTTEYGNLGELIEMYSVADGLLSQELKPYVKIIGNVPLVDNATFKSLLKKAGNDDPLMAAVQDSFFDIRYFKPAQKWATANKFEMPLSMLVIYDSYIHSGSILPVLRSRFSEKPPSGGGDEKVWIQQYVEVRHKWLLNHKNPVVRPSAYRTRDLLREIKRGNWGFEHLPIIANGTPVDDQPWDSRPKVPKIKERELTDLVPFLGEPDDDEIVSPPISAGNNEAAIASTAFSQAANSKSEREAALRQLAEQAGVTSPVSRLIDYRNQYRPASNPRFWAVVNFELHSSKPRLFLFDSVARTVGSHLCAHGRGSEGIADDGYADLFSNEDGSNCSSLGIYHCDTTYFGSNGKSLYLDGLESSNSNARQRHIVLHGADYVSPELIKSTGRIGRSLGCPAVEMGDSKRIVEALSGGSLLIVWKANRTH